MDCLGEAEAGAGGAQQIRGPLRALYAAADQVEGQQRRLYLCSATWSLPPGEQRTAGLTAGPEATAHLGLALHGFTDLAEDVARRVAHVTGHEPVALDLSQAAAPFHAVQVVCPGTRSRIRWAMPR
ncbi:hypothetical protein [Streptomyces sp. NPDC090798]|uniref:hypothetical protein n=1 Tax=Streptomyces sp. NPDC090798 TaxID=3365968 RepID=UPI00380C8554